MRALVGVELPGFRAVEPDVWVSDAGDVLSLHFFGLRPDLPASLDDGPSLRAGLTRLTADAGGGLIEASVKTLGELPALRQILKLPLPGQPNGQVFIGSFTVPRAECSTVVKIQAPERGMTGMREAMVMAQVGPDAFFRAHPYAPEVQGGLPFHAADHTRYDTDFPDHPLTRVRNTLAALAEGVRVTPEFATLAPFAG
ncbi:hypothetical protein Q5762_00480 [Streptomyces sp. P9(2023)]|uniref:hypothetical protein n=1 Tax=Streptomyces sp. P9(2023) TaxID=3064394 RepID=UPI0028F44E31|nr:hypothetical protein [Streptomyces sp. P9(2023)]MDT9686851.1 hypothetical protein [Streptomyces sp. P9(2023)]